MLERSRINLIDYKVKGIIYPHGEYRLGAPVEIIDEGGFYRIDGTHIFDKHKMEKVVQENERIRIEMTDRVVILKIVL